SLCQRDRQRSDARALVQEFDRVSLVEIDTGRKLWTVPIESLRSAGVSSDGKRIVAVAAKAVYAIDAESGRIIGSSPIMLTEKGSVAIDPTGTKIAYENAGSLVVLNVVSGVAQTIAEIGPSTAQ